MTKDNTESKSVIKRVAHQKKTKAVNQEKIFNKLWPDKCWHKEEVLGYGYCMYCGVSLVQIKDKPPGAINSNPDFTTYDGMGEILERLRELRHDVSVYTFAYQINWFCDINEDGTDEISGIADTAPLAVLSAVSSLIEKEEKV